MAKSIVREYFWPLLLLIEFIFNDKAWSITKRQELAAAFYALERVGKFTGRVQIRHEFSDWETVNGN